jgi:hypothetical protein
VSDDPLSQTVQELELVTNERDQARRELIAYDAIHGKLSVAAAAKARGWGYLIKENKIV